MQLGGAVRKLALLWVIVVACAAPAKTSSQAPSKPMVPTVDRHDEIERLSSEIESERERMALPEPPALPEAPQSASATAVPMEQVPSSQAADCHHGTSQTCTDSCTLSDQICQNAQKICDLAHQLQGDGWAAAKCDHGKQTCDAAHASCCACQQ